MKKAAAFALALTLGLCGGAWAATDFAEGDFIHGPTFTPAPEMAETAGVPKGTVHTFTMRAEDSRIFPGIRRKPGYQLARDPWGNGLPMPADVQSVAAPYQPRFGAVYIPAGYRPGTPAPVLIVQDGRNYVERVAKALDNLIAQKRVPAMVVVFVSPGNLPVGETRTEDGQGSQRGHEYDTVSGRYSDFIETEVLPKVAKDYDITFTKDPEGRATMGGSSGAAAAFTMAWFHPERYRRVLIYSGTFVNQQSPRNPKVPYGAWEYHSNTKIIEKSPVKPIRIWMQVSENDNHFGDPEESQHNWPMANHRMAAVLKAKGYHYRYLYSKTARHVDRAVIDETLPAALEWLWKGYPTGG